MPFGREDAGNRGRRPSQNIVGHVRSPVRGAACAQPGDPTVGNRWKGGPGGQTPPRPTRRRRPCTWRRALPWPGRSAPRPCRGTSARCPATRTPRPRSGAPRGSRAAGRSYGVKYWTILTVLTSPLPSMARTGSCISPVLSCRTLDVPCLILLRVGPLSPTGNATPSLPRNPSLMRRRWGDWQRPAAKYVGRRRILAALPGRPALHVVRSAGFEPAAFSLGS